MDNIIITGANGQLGNELKKLSSLLSNYRLIFTDVEELDITDPKALNAFFSAHPPVCTINCAAYTAVDKAESDADKAELINAKAVQNLVMESAKHWAPFIHVSTDYVFDGTAKKPYTEESSPNPQTVYGTTKLQGERHVLSYDRGIIIRTAWLYSEFGNNFVKTMLRLGNEKESINVVNDQIGSPTYAEDLALAIITITNKILDEPKRELYGLYQYTDDKICSWYDFAVEIMHYAGLNCKVNPIPSSQYPAPAKRPAYSVLSKRKIKSVFGVKTPDWKESLHKCMDILLSK